MTQIVCLAGAKESGKTTAANFLHGHLLKLNEVIREYDITKDGELKVNTHYMKDGEVKEDMGVLDLSRKDDLYVQYADQMIWPYVKMYNFADALKELCITMFDISHEQAYGSYKNSLTKLKWENMPGVITPEKAKSLFSNDGGGYDEQHLLEHGIMVHKPGFMTAREVLQYVGTDIFRRMYEPVWIKILMNKIKMDSPLVAVIADCRFDNEAQAVKDEDGTIVRLTRRPTRDSHASEEGLKEFTDFDLVLDNEKLDIKSANQQLLEFLVQKGISEFVNKAE
jgi:hypothetical protein